VAVGFGALPDGAPADALVVTRAMLAGTVMEVFVEPDSIVVEVEIGSSGATTFRDILPDEIYESLGFPAEAWRDRLLRFPVEGLVFTEGDDRPLPGRLVFLEPRTRVIRDEITGEPLPVAPEDEEQVLFARLVYPTSGRPARITMAPPFGPRGMIEGDIGFIVYHQDVPVNDFRYLGGREGLDLDWSDPFYSEFDRRTLRRQYYAAMNAFLYVEPYEVRKEIVLRPLDLQRWVDLGIEGQDTIRAEDQAAILDAVAEFLGQRGQVTIDGVPVAGEVDRVHFIYRNLRTSGVLDPPEDLPTISATIGAIFRYPVDGLPEQVTLEWDLFDDRIQEVTGAATDEAGPLPEILWPDDNVITWTNYLQNPTIPGLVPLVDPPSPVWRWAVGLGWLLVAAGVVVAALGLRTPEQRRARAMAGAGLVLAGLVLVPVARSAGAMTSDRTQEVVHGILLNVYKSFDFREEERIYDLLAQTADGPLLTEIYLETQRALELENQGGARAKVVEVDVLEANYEPLDAVGRGFRTRAVWNVAGSVGHWGHLHQRVNQYEALLTFDVIDGAWKIVEMELLQEERLPSSTI
jgi:hypothetical protein